MAGSIACAVDGVPPVPACEFAVGAADRVPGPSGAVLVTEPSTFTAGSPLPGAAEQRDRRAGQHAASQDGAPLGTTPGPPARGPPACGAPSRMTRPACGSARHHRTACCGSARRGGVNRQPASVACLGSRRAVSRRPAGFEPHLVRARRLQPGGSPPCRASSADITNPARGTHVAATRSAMRSHIRTLSRRSGSRRCRAAVRHHPSWASLLAAMRPFSPASPRALLHRASAVLSGDAAAETTKPCGGNVLVGLGRIQRGHEVRPPV